MRLIDADEAIERFTQIRPVNPKQSDYTHGIDVGLAFAKAAIRDQKTIEPQCKTDEWCSDCKEYDQEKHCCPRWNRVIRQTLKDAQPDIIHCGECRHFATKGNIERVEFGKCSVIKSVCLREDYCSWAERKEGEADERVRGNRARG